MVVIFFAFLSVFLLPRTVCSTDLPQAVECTARVNVVANKLNDSKILCQNVGVDGRLFDDVLFQSNYVTEKNENYTFDQLASTTTHIEIFVRGNLEISSAAFSRLPQLHRLQLKSPNIGQWTLSGQGFKNAPNLKSLSLQGLKLSEDVLQALGELKNRMDALSIGSCSPGKKIIKEIAKFTNLSLLTLYDLCEHDDFPEDTLKNSASKLSIISISGCNLKKMTKDTLKGMSNLTTLRWVRGNITSIEPRAFDDLVKLQFLTMDGIRMKNLPHGLFEKNKELKEVKLRGSDVENLSRSNFTHCEQFEALHL